MKRDMDLIRQLLLRLNEKDTTAHVDDIEVNGFTKFEVGYNLLLMYDAGLLIAEPQKTNTGRTISILPFDLTWEGHELLDKIRNDSIWEEIKHGYKEKGLKSISIDLLKRMSDKFIREKLGL